MILAAANSGSTFTFDSAADLEAIIFQIPKTGTIANIHYRIAGVTSPVMTHRISLQTVSTSTGLPNGIGSLYGSSTGITVDASTYTAATNYTAAVNCTGATAGDVVALVFDLSAFTSGSFTQQQRVAGTYAGDDFIGFPSTIPYCVQSTAGVTAKQTGIAILQCFALEYSGTTFVPINVAGFAWVGTVSSAAVTNSGTTRRGNAFTPAVKRRAIGIYGEFKLVGNNLLRLRLASDDSILATATTNVNIQTSSAQGSEFYLFDSGTTVTLTPGTAYYVTFEGGDASGGTIYFLQNAPSNAMLDIMPGGKNCYGVTYAGSYTTANTTRYAIGLITDQEDDGTGVVMSRVRVGM
jgi:hypothetical protein